MSARWTSPDDIATKVRRRWADGSLLRAHATGEPFPTIAVALRGPKPSEIGDDLGAVQDWVARLDAGRRGDVRYALEFATVGGRHFGRNRLPSKAVVSTYPQAWATLGVAPGVRRFEEVLRLVVEHPPVHGWVLAHPHQALELHTDWPRLLAAYVWLDAHRGSAKYLREITAPGVDTKFAERHRATLAALLGVPSTATGFITGLGLGVRRQLVQLRVSPGLGLPTPLSELAVRADELAALHIVPSTVLVCENEITYLSVPVPDDGAVIWGKGFEVDRVGRLPWMADVEVTYWGDLDTHGFAILDRLRTWLPHTRSVLMDRETLLAHRERWGTDATPTRAALTRLTPDEHALYVDLVGDDLGDRVRLEQERIDWSWVEERLDARSTSVTGPPR